MRCATATRHRGESLLAGQRRAVSVKREFFCEKQIEYKSLYGSAAKKVHGERMVLGHWDDTCPCCGMQHLIMLWCLFVYVSEIS